MNTKPRRAVLLAAFSLALTPASTIAQAQAPAVKASQAWARATAASGRTGAAYLTLTAPTADAIMTASSPVAETVELHRTVNENGVMKMLPAPELILPAGQAVELKPGSLHIMLIGLKRQLKQGESFPLTLTFRAAPPLTLDVKIMAAGAPGPAGHHGH